MSRSISLRSYLFLSHAILLAASLGSIGFIWSRNEYEVITQEMQSLLEQRASLFSGIVGHELAEHGNAVLEQNEFPQIHIEENMRAVFIDNTGELHELIRGSVNPAETDLFHQLDLEYSDQTSSFSKVISTKVDSTSVYAVAPVLDAKQQTIGQICLLMPIGYLDVYIARLRWILAVAISFVVILGAGGSILLTNYFSRQFSRAQSLAATVSEGNYHVRIPEGGPTELRDLSRYLNEMAEKLEGQVKVRRQLLANVAHELARPLAGIQLGIESLRKGALQDPDFADDLLVNMSQTVRRLESLIDDVTLAAHPDNRPIELQCSALALGPFLQGIATRFWTQAELRGTRLDVYVEPNLPLVYADEKRLNQIVGNLLDNAVKFTGHNGRVRISAECADEHTVRISVQDSGPGIPKEDLENIFEPFYQGDVGRRIKQGMGLGLAIAHQLASAHGGNLDLSNHPNGGAVATLTLPMAHA